MSEEALSQTSSKSSLSHQEASSSLFDRGLITVSEDVVKNIFDSLNLKIFGSNEEASQEASTFVNFLEDLKRVNNERELQNSLKNYLKSIILQNYNIIENERTNEDHSRCDLIISRGKSTQDGKGQLGRPAVLIELKSPKLWRSFTLSGHIHQIVRYAKELLSKHVSVAALPFVLFNGKSFYLGLAEWQSFNKLELKVDKMGFSIFESENKPNVFNIACLLQIFKFPGQLRPRRIQIDSQAMYKLIRVIGYGASSVVYQAQKVPIEDVGKPVRRSYPYSTNTVTVIKDDSSDSEDDELDQEEMYEFNEANPDVNIDNESNIEHNEMDLDTIESLNTSLSSSHSSIYHSKSPSPLGQKHFSDGNDQFPPKDEIIVDPVTDPIEVTEVSCQLVVLKFSAHSSPLQNEIYVDSLLDSEYKVGWENQLYSLSKGGRQFCQFCPFVPAPLQYTDKFLIIGQLHRPLIKSVFGIPYKNALALVRDDLMPLLDNLIAIHDSNIIHRDIRPANILKKGDRFIISDFGFAVRAGEEYVEYQGTRETASQRILDKLSRGIFVGEVLQEDDLESFLKLVKISFWGLRLPALNGNKIKYYEDLFRFWMVDHDILYFISLPNLESKRKFLRIFCRKNISLAQARQLYGSSLP